MINITLYRFSKKVKSTAIPTDEGTALNCNLKAPTSILAPALEFANIVTPYNYNYAYIPAFGRYYFINNWTWDRGLWIASASVDHLASWKQEIGSSSLYISRSASSYDGNIIDGHYPTDSQFTFNRQTVFPMFNSAITQGEFIVGVVSKNANIGALEYLIFGYDEMVQLLSYLTSNDFLINNGFTDTDFSIALQKSLVDPLQYIRSCVWIPSQSFFLGEAQENTTIFSWTVPVRSSRITTPKGTQTRTFTNLIRHPQATERGAFCNLPPYTTASLYFPPFGLIPLDMSEFSKTSELVASYTQDAINGAGRLEISMNGNITNVLNGQVGVPINLSQVKTGEASGVAKILGGAIASGIGIASGVGAIAFAGAGLLGAGIKDSASAMLGGGKAQSLGGTGSFSDLESLTPAIYYEFAHIVDDDIVNNGRPLCKKRIVNTLSGFLIAENGIVNAPATETELDAIRSDLENGIYYE